MSDSLFVPCINTVKAAELLRYGAKKRGMRLKFATRMHEGRWGLRLWRVM